MSGIDKVMAEVFPDYARRKAEKAEKSKTKPENRKHEEDEDMKQEDNASTERTELDENVQRHSSQRRRRRVVKPKSSSDGSMSPNMYTIAIVGTIGMEGYQLKEGEKLVIAKLTPIPITK